MLENNFNILRMFVRIYGASAAPAMLVSSTLLAYLTNKKLLELYLTYSASNFVIQIWTNPFIVYFLINT